MKIKTITCHDVYNAGASLQAYALYTYLNNLGHDVEIIDYKPDYLSKHYSFSVVGNPVYERNVVIKYLYLLAKFPRRLFAYLGKRKRNYDHFKKKYLKLTPTRFISNEHLKNDLPEADVYFAGSDQIWNPMFRNGKDPAFFLDFVPNDRVRASYAASFAVNSLTEESEKLVYEWLSKMNFLSVRESSGLEIIKKIGVEFGEVVLDPVFLLGMDEWDYLNETQNNYTEKYVLIYDFDNSDIIRKCAEKIAEKKKYKIYSVLKCKYADRCFESGGPIEFLKLIRNAEFVISNSFHATAFSLIYEKQFIVINRNEDINTRMRDLVNDLELTDRIINEGLGIDKLSKIDYKEVKVLLNDKIVNSKNYIQRVLESVENEK